MKTTKILASAILVGLFMIQAGFASQTATASLNLGHMDYVYHTDSETHWTTATPPQSKYGDTPEDSIQCVRNLSLYAEYYNQRNFNLAYEPWRKVLELCPQASQNTYIRGVVLIKMKYNEETDPIRREAWIDTLMMVYDKRVDHFGREGFVTGRKAVDLYQLRPNNIQEIHELSSKSIEMEGNNSQADVLLINMQSLIKLTEAGVKPEEEVLRNYDVVMDIIDYNLEHNPGDKRFFEPAKENIDRMFRPFASCENIVTIFQPRYENNPEDVELLRKITSMLEESDCTKEELFYNATRSLHDLEPTANSAFLMGRLELEAEKHEQAVEFFRQAVDLYEDDEDKFNALMRMADITYRNLREFSQARTYALEASGLNPENGRPYILIGEMYAASASACGDDELTKSVAYWAAVDKFIQARNVDQDPSVQERAKQLIDTYTQYFPNRELTFFHGLEEGDSYRVECWINETTTVRTRQ